MILEIMITVTILALVLDYKSFCNTVCIYMVMQIKLVVVVVVVEKLRLKHSLASNLFPRAFVTLVH